MTRTVALEAYNFGREQAGCEGPPKEMNDFFRDRRAAGKGSFLPDNKIGQMMTHMKIFAGEAYLDMSTYYREQTEDNTL